MEASDIILICLDRDGTINLDEHYYLGSVSHWKEQINFLPGVIEGLRLLNTIPNAKIIITTNQSGIALMGTDMHSGTDFELLTEDRAHEVNRHIIDVLKLLGCRVDGYQLCPYVTSEYAKKAAAKGRTVEPKYIKDDARCRKPNIGMLEDAAAIFGKKLEDIKKKFMVGDFAGDVETGIRAKCISFFVESSGAIESNEKEKVLVMQKSAPAETVFIEKDFLTAAQKIKELAAVN